MPLSAGTRFGSYEISGPIGAGGMGEVYRARDTRLGRDVALKFLPAEMGQDAERRARFEQEARALAALSHPNIVSVYDVGRENGVFFIVSELVDGESLRQVMGTKPVELRRVIDIASQTADGLAAAHAAGIVHRDLKPENIMLTRDGWVKILDFGLAKQTNTGPEDGASTMTQALTNPGTVMGTVGYMSPEQASGYDLDSRSDLFSLGVILYEMTTGRRPFRGATFMATIDSILHETPTPPVQLNPDLHPGLAQIIEKSLEKDRDVRYQTASDMRADLKRLKRDTESSPGQTPRAAVAARHPRGALIVIAVLAGIAILAMAAALTAPRWTKSSSPVQSEWVQLTNFTDSATSPTLSPDGRMLTFIRGSGTFITPGQIYVALLPGGEPKQLTHDTLAKMSPVFSLDGSRIAYTVVTPAFAWDTWVLPVLGGEPRRLLPNASGLTWIDAKRVLYSEIKSGAHMAVVTADESRAGQRDIYLPPHARGMGHRSYLSPDGRSVLLVEMENGGFLPCRVVPFDGSSPGKRVGPATGPCTYAAWSPDGQWMYLNADVGGNGFHLWRQRIKGGEPEQITFGPTEQEGIAVAADGHSLISSVGERQSSVWIHNDTGEHQISSEGFGSSPHFSANGKKLYYLIYRRGTSRAGELWVAEMDSGHSEELLPGFAITPSGTPVTYEYDLSSDGKRVVFSAVEGNGRSHLWIASLDHRRPPYPVLTPADDLARFGPNGDLLFRSNAGKLNYFYHAKEDGSGRDKVTPEPILSLGPLSPDRKWAMTWTAVPEQEALATSADIAYPTSGGTPMTVCARCELSWTPDGKYLYIWLPGGTSEMAEGPTFRIPLRSGQAFPPLLPAGIRSRADLEAIPGAMIVAPSRVVAGPDSSTYAFTKESVHRNLYRIPLP